MRFGQAQNYLELLALLGRQAPFAGTGRWRPPLRGGGADLSQTVRLVREGIREYDERLDTLERQFAQWKVEPDRYDPIPGFHDRDRDQPSCERNLEEDVDRLASRCLRLTEIQIHHIFNELAILRCRLNGRGYPYTSDVDEQRRRIYPDCELIVQRDVEAAWDDWGNDAGKLLFSEDRREAVPSYVVREAVRDIEEVTAELAQLEFEALFGCMCGNGGESRRSCPERDEFAREQTRFFPRTRLATEEEIQQAFGIWVEWRDHPRGERVATTFGSASGEQIEQILEIRDREPVRKRHRSPSREQVFRAFDEILLGLRWEGSVLTRDSWPDLRLVNERLKEHRHATLKDEAALRRDWIEYLVLGAKMREAKAEERRKRKPNRRVKTGGRRSARGHSSPRRVNGESRVIVFEQEAKASDGDGLRERGRK